MSSIASWISHLRAAGLLAAFLSIPFALPTLGQFPTPLAEQVVDLETTGEPLLIPGPIMGIFFEVWGSAPSQLIVLGEELAFVADDRLHGAELWMTDGTADGTRLVADICEGSCGSSPFLLGALEGELLFAAFQEATGFELWATDGTGGGTRLVTELCPGDCSGFLRAGWMGSFDPRRSAVLESELYFSGYDEVRGEELWATDGTAMGTRLVGDLCEDLCFSSPRSFVSYGDEIWFTASEQEGVRRVWRVSASAGPSIVPDLCGTKSLAAKEPLVHDDRLYWLGSCYGENFSEKRTHLIVEDAGALVSLGQLPLDGRGYAGIAYSLRSVGERLFFLQSPFDYAVSDEIWVSGGVEGAPLRKVDVTFPNGGSFSGADLGPLRVLGEAVFFFAGERSGSTVWRSDGTEAGTWKLADLFPLYGYHPEIFGLADQRIFFAARDSSGRSGLWISGGVPANTYFAQALEPGREIDDPGEAIEFGGRVIFPAIADPDQGAELWALNTESVLADRCFGPSDTTLCLGDRRFEVTVQWNDSRVGAGDGHAHRDSGSSGLFWFFREENLELAVKVLDGTSVNGHHWVGYGALSDVEYSIQVLDRMTGERASYFNPKGHYCGSIDVSALPGPGSTSQSHSPPRLVFAQSEEPTGACVADEETLCLREGRFAVSVDWQSRDRAGMGHAIPGGDESGKFWFFAPKNLELLVKVLDGRSINGHFWLYWGALTDVEYWLRVEDTVTGEVREYHNPQGTLCGGSDIGAF